LLLNKLQQMQKSDLSKVLDISRPTANKFYSEVSPDYITETESGLVWTESGCFYRGAGLAMSKDAAYMKVFCDSIKKLYKGLQGKGHKYLGYIFQLLPYVNREHNILCWNPEEKEKCSIQRMNLLDVCGLVGFDTKHIDRLFNIFASQKFDIDGCEEGYFRLLNQPNSNDYRTADILINPHLFYAGTDFRQADYAYATGARRKKLASIEHQ
nr:hypothetical protein [Oscillospiraceae bacterium]